MTETRPGPDELRVRGLLRKRGVGPDAEVPPLPPAPARLPTGYEPRARDWLDDILDTTPSPAPAVPRTAPDPDPVDDPDLVQPREPRNWSWLWAWIRPWQTLTAGAVAVLPLFNGWSLATAWARILHDMRDDTIGGAYTTAGIALAIAYGLDLRHRRWLLRLALITTAVGSLGVLDWFDPITFLTGVHR